MGKNTYEHTNIQGSYPSMHKNLNDFSLSLLSFSLNSNPTRRYLKKLELDYIYCPDCESQHIIFHGKDTRGTQRFKCKQCNLQFVTQLDAIFPRSTRTAIFEQEFNSNIKPTGFNKIGSGKKCYWAGAKWETLQQIESQRIKVWFNKILKTHTIQSLNDYQVMLEFLLHKAYGDVMAKYEQG